LPYFTPYLRFRWSAEVHLLVGAMLAPDEAAGKFRRVAALAKQNAGRPSALIGCLP